MTKQPLETDHETGDAREVRQHILDTHSKRMKPYIGLYRGFYFCYVEGHLYRGLKYPQIWVYVEGRHIEGFLPYIKGLF